MEIISILFFQVWQQKFGQLSPRPLPHEPLSTALRRTRIIKIRRRLLKSNMHGYTYKGSVNQVNNNNHVLNEPQNLFLRVRRLLFGAFLILMPLFHVIHHQKLQNYGSFKTCLL